MNYSEQQVTALPVASTPLPVESNRIWLVQSDIDNRGYLCCRLRLALLHTGKRPG
jgi:hypothetical protein